MLIVLASICVGSVSYILYSCLFLGLAAREGVWYKVCQDVEIAM